jgi:hypothetical protein
VTSAVCVAEAGAQTPPPTLRIPRVTQPPKLQDFLTGTPREAETRVTDFRQREPGDGIAASQETTAYLSYDDKNLYAVFVCKDDPGKVRAHMAKREDIGSDDRVGVFLDTFHDHQRAYLFVTNPLGIQQDAITMRGLPDDLSFDTLWHSEGRLTSEGFVVWMAIPFKSLRFPSAPVQNWGVVVGRYIARNNETSFWPYVTLRVESLLQQMATLEGLEQISPGRNVQLIPYGMFTRARFLDALAPSGPAFRVQTDERLGLDAKVVLRDALTLDVTLNPDFSQVESDEPQVTINQRFEVFFPEKRPFFIENAGFFETPVDFVAGSYETPINLFFSRRIVDPEFGARLTGKVARWVIGALAIDDRAPGQLVPVDDPLRGRRAGIGVVRIRREFASQSDFGVLVTSRDFASSWNRVFSLDTRLKLNPNWILTGQVMRSYTRELDGTRLSGGGYYARTEHRGRHFSYHGRYVDFSPDFRTQVGFVNRVDIRQTEHHASYLWRPENRRVLSFGPYFDALANWDRQGRLQNWLGGVGLNLEFPRQTIFSGWRKQSFELFQNQGFHKEDSGFTFSTEWLKWLTALALLNSGRTINYYPASGLAPFGANGLYGQLEFTLRPTPRLRFGQSYIYDRLGMRDDSRPPGTPATASIYNNHILRTKFNYQFTRPLSLRVILDYNSVLPNPSLVALERAKRFSPDILVTYLVNPGTALYVGYTDRYENLDILPTVPPTLGRIGSPSVSTGRQFFVKLSYLLRF